MARKTDHLAGEVIRKIRRVGDKDPLAQDEHMRNLQRYRRLCGLLGKRAQVVLDQHGKTGIIEDARAAVYGSHV